MQPSEPRDKRRRGGGGALSPLEPECLSGPSLALRLPGPRCCIRSRGGECRPTTQLHSKSCELQIELSSGPL